MRKALKVTLETVFVLFCVVGVLCMMFKPYIVEATEKPKRMILTNVQSYGRIDVYVYHDVVTKYDFLVVSHGYGLAITRIQ